MAFLGLLSFQRWRTIESDLSSLALFLILVALVDLLPIRHANLFHLSLSLPLLVAAGMIFDPVEVGLLALLGSGDPRELRGEIGPGRALFNRAQIALSATAASFLFHALGGQVDQWPHVLVVGLLALAADAAINFGFVLLGISLATGTPIREVPSRAVPCSTAEYLLVHLGLGLIAVFFALAFEYVGPWGLALSVVPIAFVRQMFTQLKRSALAVEQAKESSRLLSEIKDRIADERRDERARVAGALHDEILQSLQQVQIMGEVRRQDLSTGQLLALEEDLPSLVKATNQASSGIRSLIRDLRHSSVGSQGAASTLQLLVHDLETESNIRIETKLEDLVVSPMTQLLVYQVGREALRNAVNHSGSDVVLIELHTLGKEIQLTVTDRGKGFDVSQVDKGSHFGLQMMRERIESLGGTLAIRSVLGVGTEIAAVVPRQDPDLS